MLVISVRDVLRDSLDLRGRVDDHELRIRQLEQNERSPG